MRAPWITVVSAAIALAGCATPAEQAARMEREMDRYIEIYSPACEKLGFQRDTDPWRNCILRVSQDCYTTRYGYGYPYYPMTTTCMGNPGLVHCTSF